MSHLVNNNINIYNYIQREQLMFFQSQLIYQN